MEHNSLSVESFNGIESYSSEFIGITSTKDIAIIGMAATFPKAEDLNEFWSNLVDGKDCIGNFPEKRKEDIDKYLNYIGMSKDKIKYLQAGYLDEIDKFDCRFFRLTPKEASLMNPSQRLFLQTAWKTIEDAGYGGNRLVGSNTGVFVGYIGDFQGDKYGDMISRIDESNSAISIVGNLSSIIPSRISYMLDLKGPSMLIDTACSSSLVAIHMACKSIQNGECELALSGGVKVYIMPLESSEKIGIESSDGKTRAFDENSDGTGIGEGVAAVLLKPLNKALKDGDNIYAIIKGSAVNQDGKSIGITAPNVKAQSSVIIKAWKNAGINPETISYIEAHGTGTKLGDPIEIDGIKKAFERYTHKKQFCGIGSVKSNIGHLYDCAGIASFIKVVLSIRHRYIPPSINFFTPNKSINFEDSPLYVNDRLKKWNIRSGPLRAGVSSFGFSGTNCHIVLEEAPFENNLEKPEVNFEHNIFVISAKTEKTLKELILKYNTFLKNAKDINFKDICYTASTGRKHYNFRIAVISKDTLDLREKLDYLCCTDSYESVKYNSNIFYGGNILTGEREKINISLEDVMNRFFHHNKSMDVLKEICSMYVKGADFKWSRFYKNERRKKISLPTYSFQKERCWLEIPDGIEKNVHLENKLEDYEVILKGKKENEKYSDIEILLARIWGKELGFREIDIFESFYELGGDSIMAVKIVNSLNKKIGKQINISQVLKYQTIYDFARYLTHSKSDNIKCCYEIPKAAEMEYYPLSSAQKRLYILSQLNRSDINYNMPFAVVIHGKVDTKRFDDTFKELIKIHEAFRTSFHIENEEPVQKISSNVEFEVYHKNLNLDSVEMFIENFVRPFDLDKAPLLRAALLKINEDKYVMIIDMHHIISDGTSMGILLKHFADLYNGLKVSESKLYYRDFAVWQRQFSKSEYMKKQEKYWNNLFKSGVPILNMPTDYERPEIQGFQGDILKVTLDEKLTSSILNFCMKAENTLFMVLLSGYYILLSKYSGQEDIVVGSPVACRPNSDLQNIVGMFVNMLALRNNASMDKSYREFLYEVKYNVLEAFENQDYQFDDLVDSILTTREAARNPIFDTVFALQNMDIPDIKIDGLKLTPFDENKKCKFDITFEAIEREDVINLNVQYCVKLFKRDTMERFVRDYINILKTVVKNPDIKLKQIDIEYNLKLLEEASLDEVEFDF